MTTVRGPGFVDEPERWVPEPPPVAIQAAPLPSDGSGPMLLDVVLGEDRARIDPLWNPELVASRSSDSSSLTWVAGGLTILLLGWLLLSLVAFAEDQFRRSTTLGVLTVTCFGIGFSLMAYGLWCELRAFRALQRVDDLRRRFSRDDLSMPKLRADILPWLQIIRHHLEKPDRIVSLIEAATSPAGIAAVLRHEVVGPLRQAARRAGRRAALEGGAMVAITPTPALEGVIIGIRALILVRQVASIYGIRPGFLVMIALLRRVAWTSAGVSGLALLSQTLAAGTLHQLPLLGALAGALPETGLAAVRLYGLANITAEACSPISGDGDS
jgi:putative membrane protein